MFKIPQCADWVDVDALSFSGLSCIFKEFSLESIVFRARYVNKVAAKDILISSCYGLFCFLFINSFGFLLFFSWEYNVVNVLLLWCCIYVFSSYVWTDTSFFRLSGK